MLFRILRVLELIARIMAGRLPTKACSACAMAKRRCERQKPCCSRCRKRGIECRYPPPRRTNFVLCEGEYSSPVAADVLPYGNQLCVYSAANQSSRAEDGRLVLGPSPSSPGTSVDNQVPSTWFTSQHTWEILPLPQAEYGSFAATDLRRTILRIHEWLRQWIEKESNPFIHSHLYQTRFPRSVQDAYTALSSYFNKTASNERIVLRIIEDRAKLLVSEQGRDSGATSPESVAMNSVSLDSLEQLARVHALLVYQIIGLCDGDIRLRHLAESYIPVLDSWLQQMIEQASQTTCLGSFMVSPAHEKALAGLSLSDIERGSNLLWYSWILAESIRRTWIIASGLQTIYLAIQQGRAVPCKGSMVFTTRGGVWEAQSAPAWEKLCAEVNVGLMQISEMDRLLAESTPEDVNDFTKMIFESAFGGNIVERWELKYKTNSG
ncbi:hypothetical protein F5884DRAFT_786166 [Xylogone sp. PMI_703]|nr:hypothetical protein F5884DRAFT_786166 [Xylogone sp. PMI_703]